MCCHRRLSCRLRPVCPGCATDNEIFLAAWPDLSKHFPDGTVMFVDKGYTTGELRNMAGTEYRASAAAQVRELASPLAATLSSPPTFAPSARASSDVRPPRSIPSRLALQREGRPPNLLTLPPVHHC